MLDIDSLNCKGVEGMQRGIIHHTVILQDPSLNHLHDATQIVLGTNCQFERLAHPMHNPNHSDTVTV